MKRKFAVMGFDRFARCLFLADCRRSRHDLQGPQCAQTGRKDCWGEAAARADDRHAHQRLFDCRTVPRLVFRRHSEGSLLSSGSWSRHQLAASVHFAAARSLPRDTNKALPT